MQQADRGSYRKKESFLQMFFHSCLGKLIILAAIIVVLLLIAIITVPSDKKMQAEMVDDIRQCIEANDSIKGDWIDDAVNNVGYIFTHADSTVNKELMADFNKYNRLEIYKHTFYKTARIHNNFRPEGTRVGFGIFGLVIPTVNFNDFLLRVGPIRKSYNQKIIRSSYSSGYDFGHNPDLGDTYNTYDGRNSLNAQ